MTADHPVLMFPEALRAARKTQGIKAGELAARLGVSARTLRRWECGHCLPSPTLFPELERVLEADLAASLDDGTLPGLIKVLRMRLGVTCSTLAATLGASESTVQMWESGRSIPSPGMVARLASAAGVDASEIEGRLGGPACLFTGGETIKRLRRRAGLTQHGLARELGVSTKTLAGWERGRHRPKPEHRSALEAALAARPETTR